MTNNSWTRFKQYLYHNEDLGLALDLSRMNFGEDFMERMAPAMDKAYGAMEALEGGAIANPDENRMVGHYWLRAADLAPQTEQKQAIVEAIQAVKGFVSEVHDTRLRGSDGEPFHNFLLVGIGGSALGPQLVADALGRQGDALNPYFIDNTDPDGIRRTLAGLEGELDRTLVIVISKSGGTQETRNGMLETQAAYERARLKFSRHAVAVTGTGSALYNQARDEGWMRIFPMWDWVGGRTSVTSAVGLLPAALQGLDIDAFLEGARAMDAVTRGRETMANPAALMALMWFWAGEGKGLRDLVILPYKDRLVLLSKYLQQLVMESIGKERDLKGNVVNQGLAVYGNKGSTDQHAYVQQLREGLNNFFVTFIEVLGDDAGSGGGDPLEVAPGVTAGDFLEGFLLGTRRALAEKGRESMTLSVIRLNARTLGMLIALFERAVGLYAALIGINAYHQPGVEAGKVAAKAVIALQDKLLAAMKASPAAQTAEQWADAIGESAETETVYKLLQRLSANAGRGVSRTTATSPFAATYKWVG